MRINEQCQHDEKVHFAYMNGFYCPICRNSMINNRWVKKFRDNKGKNIEFEPEIEEIETADDIEIKQYFTNLAKFFFIDENGNNCLRVSKP